MKLAILSIFSLAIATAPASAIVNLGLSTQSFTFTGIGGNSAGEGQNTVSWGACAFDGTNTNCTVSGAYTGFGPGGTYSFVLSYPGNGAFPLKAVSQTPGSDLISYQATGQYSLVITLTPSSGSPISFYSFANFSFFFSSPTCTGVSSCAVGQVGLTPGATITGPVTGTFDPTPSITPSGALTPEDYGSFLATAPGDWLVMYGVNLATVKSQTWSGSDFNGVQAPAALGGTTVTIAGVPAYIDYVSAGQVNVQVPSGIPTGPQPIVVTTAGGTSAAYSMNVNATEPGLLAPASFIINGNQYIVAQLSNTTTYVLPVTVPGLVTTRAKPYDSLTIYGIGFGQVNPEIPAGQIVQSTNQLQSQLAVTFAGVPATVTYAGLAPGYVGLYQFNVTVPNVSASDTVPLVFTLGGAALPQQTVIAIQN